MYCTHCGSRVGAADRYCAACGGAQMAAAVPVAARRLCRPRAGRKIAGVALGFAHYLDLDVTLIRIVLVMLALMSGGLVLLGYLVAWILMPEEESCQPAPAGAQRDIRA